MTVRIAGLGSALRMGIVPAMALGGMLLMTSAASAAVVTFQQGQDGYTGTEDVQIRNGSSYAGKNYGANAYMIISNNVTSSTSYSISRVLIRFDLSSLQGQVGTINSVTLRLRQYASGTGFSNASNGFTLVANPISAANADWVAGAGTFSDPNTGESTWNNKNAPGTSWAGSAGLMAAGTDYDSSIASTAAITATPPAYPVYIELTLDPSTVMGWINGTNAGLLLHLQDETGNNYTGNDQLQLYSSNSPTNVNTNPLLTIDYTPVPEPVTGSLLLMCGGLLALRRRK